MDYSLITDIILAAATTVRHFERVIVIEASVELARNPSKYWLQVFKREFDTWRSYTPNR